MTGQLRSEVRKLRTTRTFAVFLVVAVALALITVFAEGMTQTPEELAGEDAQRDLIGAAATNAVFLATFVGLLVVTNEFRYGTIRPTLLFEPRRRVFLAGKLAAGALAGLVLAVACVAVSFGAALPLLGVRDVDVALTAGHTLTLALGTVAASAFSAMMGVGIGALIRNQVGAIVTLAGYSVVFDALLFATVPSVGRFLPGEALTALSGLPTEDLLPVGLAAAVVLVWTLAFSAAATLRTEHTDV